VAAAVVLAIKASRRSSPRVRAAILLGLTHAALLATYYGAFFGAAHFLSRYTAPISILAALFTMGLAMTALPGAGLRLAFLGAVALLAVGLDAREYRARHEHQHFQVVDWVAANVPDDVWVGAIQTGTLGFWHDRTINLDGKTNPDALKARDAHGFEQYVIGSPIMYLADWRGIVGWAEWADPPFSVIVDDPAKNLGVLKRVR
jgi:hypothetical protein